MLLYPRNSLFNINAQTQIVELVTNKNIPNRIVISQSNIYDKGNNLIEEKFNGTIELKANTVTKFIRVGSNSLRIDIENKNDNNTVNCIVRNTKEAQLTLNDHSKISVICNDINKQREEFGNMVFNLTGEINIGSIVGNQTYPDIYPILKNGKISLIEKMIVGKGNYEVGDYALNIGDRVKILKAKSAALGLLVIDERPDMHISYRVEGKNARIIKHGPQKGNMGFLVRSSFTDKFNYDFGIQIIGTLLGLFTLFSVVVSTFFGFVEFKNSNNE